MKWGSHAQLKGVLLQMTGLAFWSVMFQIWMGQKVVTLEIDGSVFAINFLVQHAKYQSCGALWGRKMQKQFSPVNPQEKLLNYFGTVQDLLRFQHPFKGGFINAHSIKEDKEIKHHIKSNFAQAKREGLPKPKMAFSINLIMSVALKYTLVTFQQNYCLYQTDELISRWWFRPHKSGRTDDLPLRQHPSDLYGSYQLVKCPC